MNLRADIPERGRRRKIVARVGSGNMSTRCTHNFGRGTNDARKD